VIQGLLSLTRRHDAAAIERACETAHGYGAFRLRTVRARIDRQAATQEQFTFSISIRSFVNFRTTSNSSMTRFRRRDEP